MFIHLNKKGQGTLEYAIIIAVIVAALIVMQNYVKRGMQGKLRESTDSIGDQFSPKNTSVSTSVNLNATSSEQIFGGAAPHSQTDTNQTQVRSTSDDVSGETTEIWP